MHCTRCLFRQLTATDCPVQARAQLALLARAVSPTSLCVASSKNFVVAVKYISAKCLKMANQGLTDVKSATEKYKGWKL